MLNDPPFMKTEDANQVENRLAPVRQKRGISAIALAKMVGVSRQTIYAIESGSYIPNTVVALRLAKSLGVGLEELFSLPGGDGAVSLRWEDATLLPGSDTLHAGQPVQLCRIGKRLIATAPAISCYFPESDGILTGKAVPQGHALVDMHSDAVDFANRILVAGCDPAMSVLARHLQPAGVEVVLVPRNSSQSIELLRKGCVHIAGTHLRDEASGESNLPEITRAFPKQSVAVISFAVWEEGIVTARGNPKHVKGVDDFARDDISIMNREKGAGSRILLDSCLKRLGMERKSVRGYDRIALGHLPAAWQVRTQTADCCIATRSAARMFGLNFIPLVSERYDLALRRHHLKLPAIANLLDILNRSNFRRELESIGGYDISITGQRLL